MAELGVSTGGFCQLHTSGVLRTNDNLINDRRETLNAMRLTFARRGETVPSTCTGLTTGSGAVDKTVKSSQSDVVRLPTVQKIQ